MKKSIIIIWIGLLFLPNFAVAASWYDTLPQDRQFVPLSEDQVKQPIDFEDLNSQSSTDTAGEMAESPDPEQEVAVGASPEQQTAELDSTPKTSPGIPAKIYALWIILGLAAIGLVVWLVKRFRNKKIESPDQLNKF